MAAVRILPLPPSHVKCLRMWTPPPFCMVWLAVFIRRGYLYLWDRTCCHYTERLAMILYLSWSWGSPSLSSCYVPRRVNNWWEQWQVRITAMDQGNSGKQGSKRQVSNLAQEEDCLSVWLGNSWRINTTSVATQLGFNLFSRLGHMYWVGSSENPRPAVDWWARHRQDRGVFCFVCMFCSLFCCCCFFALKDGGGKY